MFVGMVGLTLSPRIMNQFMHQENPFGFKFIEQDILSIEPTVKYMHIVDYGTGIMLQQLAKNAGNETSEFFSRVNNLANESFLRAQRTMPLHADTAVKVASTSSEDKPHQHL